MPASEVPAREGPPAKALTCDICAQPGIPSWGDSILCENCYGTLGATCAGRPRTSSKTEEDSPVC